MDIKISDEEIQKLVETRIKQLVDPKVRSILNDICYHDILDMVNRTVNEIVREKLTSEIVKDIINKIDADKQIKILGESISTGIVEKLRR